MRPRSGERRTTRKRLVPPGPEDLGAVPPNFLSGPLPEQNRTVGVEGEPSLVEPVDPWTRRIRRRANLKGHVMSNDQQFGQGNPGQGGQIDPDQGNPGQGNPGQGRPDQGNPGQINPGRAKPGQDRPDQDRPDQDMPGQGGDADEPMTEENDDEENDDDN
jgi:PPE-repeat protein